MKTILTITAISLLFIFACDKGDHITPPPPVAFYSGSYEIVFLNPSKTPIRVHQFIKWTFTDQFLFCKIDTVKSIRIVCDFNGRYILSSDSMYLSDIIPSDSGCEVMYIPERGFEISFTGDDNSPDTIILSQVLSGSDYSIEKAIKLVRDGL